MSKGGFQLFDFRLRITASLFAVLLTVPLLHAGEIYQSVMQELSRHENRLPGSDAYYSSIDHLEKTLKDAGLAPHRQVYGTLAPEVRECRLTVDGVDIGPVYSLGPNGPANNTTGGRVLKGPLVYLGQGSLAEMDGNPVEGCIAVLDFDSPNLLQVLSQGALAVVYVGNGTETQWQARQQFIDIEAEIPRLFVYQEDAEIHKLTTARGERTAEVALTVIWKNVEAVNLWVEVPGRDGAKFNFDEEEAIVLTAILDTFGVVPEVSPSVRTAANCALLAEVAVNLRKHPLERSVFAVFFGSHYAMQDAARMFYFAIKSGRDGALEERGRQYLELQEESDELLAALEHEDVFSQEESVVRELLTRIEKRLSGKVSTLNYELQVVREGLLPLRRMKTRLPPDEKKMDSLLAAESRLRQRRKSLNSMRRQLDSRDVTNKVLFAEVVGEESEVVAREIEDMRKLIRNNESHRELAASIGQKRIVGHFDLDFANSSGEWTLNMKSIGSQMFYHSMGKKWAEQKIGDYVKNFSTISTMDDSLQGKGAPGEGLFDIPARSLIFPGKFCVPSIRSAPTRVAHAMQIYGYQLLTVADPLNGDEMPYRQNADLAPLVPRLTAFSAGLATDPGLSQVCGLAKPSFSDKTVMSFRGEGGYRYLTMARGSTDVAGVPENAIAFCAPNGAEESPAIAGHSYSAASRIMASGHIFMPLMFANPPVRPLGFAGNGLLQYFPPHFWHRTRLFHGVGGIINTPIIPASFTASGATIADARSESVLTPYLRRGNNFFAFYAREEKPFKLYAKGGLLLLGSTEAEPRGTGIGFTEAPLYSFNVLRQTAYDYLMLNNSRLEILRAKSILNDSLEILHADAEQHWDDAVQAREEDRISTAVAHEAFSAGISARIAPALREITNDMVRAVVLLLVLTMPFAFIMERLFINAKGIYGQVIGFVVFFIASFALMYMVHPAFDIASSPLIIFLAFVIIFLSILVISIVLSKFRRELRLMQGLGASAHAAATDSSTAMAAILIGISGMRNRPLKTFLTALTIILLTFAIVVFASFSSSVGVRKEYVGKGNGPNRIELHRFSGLELPPMLYDALASLYSKDWRTFAREAFFRGPKSFYEGALLVVYRDLGPGHKWQKLQGMLAFDRRELAFNPDLDAAVPGLKNYEGELPPLFLAERVSDELDLAEGDRVTIGGKAFTYAGTFDAGALDQMEYIDRSKITPPDFETSESLLPGGGEDGSSGTDLSDDATIDTTRFVYSSARSIGITSLGELNEFAGPGQPSRMNAMVMYAKESADVEGSAEEIAKMFPGPVMTQGATGANQFFFSKSLQVAGFSGVIVPLLLGGLIIFNSLLGSIVERQKEIFTYSAMGLSPPSVGALFFAESGVYAIMGGMGGYFLSQVVAKLVAVCGEMGWFVPPELNFSSLSSVMTSFVVMIMVMISTIYPAIKAGRSANPGVARKWKMPAPVEGKINFVFPFTVSADDMGGILAFISEHFENHGDSAIGDFAASRVELIEKDRDNGMGLRAHIALAPFDLGVMQKFSMFSRPSEIEGIDEIAVQLSKVAGTDAAWLRGNRRFMSDLREQFLFWRSLPLSAVMHYREKSRNVHGTGTDNEFSKMETETC